MAPRSLAQQKALAWLPRLTGSLSILGSVLIIRLVLKDRKKLKTTYHKVMLGISCVDAFVSIWYILSTLPIPVGTDNAYGARGTQGTCVAQGFFLQWALAACLYNLSLSIYYLLVISYGWKENQLKNVERWMHGCSWTVALGTAIAGIPLKIFNNYQGLWCWISGVPLECVSDNDIECKRGKNALIYRYAFYYGPLWCCIFFATAAMFRVYWSVRKQENAAKKWRRGAGPPKNNLSKEVAWQAFWYLLVFYVTWTPSTVNTILVQVNGEGELWLVFLKTILLPMQGFFNFLVYNRPRFKQYRRKHPEYSFIDVLGRFLCPKCCRRREKSDDDDDDQNRNSTTDASLSRYGTSTTQPVTDYSQESRFTTTIAASTTAARLSGSNEEKVIEYVEEEDMDPSALIASPNEISDDPEGMDDEAISSIT